VNVKMAFARRGFERDPGVQVQRIGAHNFPSKPGHAPKAGNPVSPLVSNDVPPLFRATLCVSHCRSFQRRGQGRAASTNRRRGPLYYSPNMEKSL
jgi:hypothetical protein